jgi:hypothetical protein
MKQTVILCQVEADHEGWEAEVDQMDRDVAFLFSGLKMEITRYIWEGTEQSRILREGYETSSPRVIKKAKKLGWLEGAT